MRRHHDGRTYSDRLRQRNGKKYDKQNNESTTETDVVVLDQLPSDPDNG